MFLHDPLGFSHVLFNMLALWMFGMDLERTWGTRGFLRYYFLCGVGAGLCVVIANLLFGNPGAQTIGASGAIYGLLMAYGFLFPDRQVLFSFLFPMKAKYFVMIIGAIAFLSSFAAPGGPVSHFAHLGGMLIGYIYLKSGRMRATVGGYGYPSARRTKRSFSPSAMVKQWYHDWKVQRARRKFEVYLRKRDQERDRDRFVH
jgi:membrane associated rhomboid family serine protease